MAITRAQQARQMLKDGNFVMQGGAKNYLGKQKTVSNVPVKWQSGPDKPSTELAYITKAEKDLLLKKDIHRSLKDGPNKGPKGIISLDSQGDFTEDRSGGKKSEKGPGDQGNFRDTAQYTEKKADYSKDRTVRGDDLTAAEKKQYEKNRRAREKDPFYGTSLEGRQDLIDQENERIEQLKKDARKNRKKMFDLKKADDKKRRDRINKILSGGFGVNNPYGLSDMELRDLEVLGYDATKGIEGIGVTGVPDAISGGTNKFFDDILTNALEKSDRLSGVNLETFQNRQLKDVAGSVPGPLLNILANSGILQPGMTRTRKFFSDKDYKSLFGKDKKSVLEAGKYTFDGKPITQAQFEMLSPQEMEMVYQDYDDRRKSGEIDAYGNEIIQTGGPDEQETDPCLGPNPPAYCFIGGNAPTTPDPVFTPSFRFMNRGGMVEDAPMGGIMDLESTRQMLFLGGIAKSIGKGLKSITRGIKKVAKSPIGKAAILGTIGYGLGGGFGAGGFKFGNLPGMTSLSKKFSGFALPDFITKNMTGLKVAGLSGLGGALLSSLENKDDGFNIDEYYKMAGIDIPENQYRFLAEGGDVEPVAKKTMPLLDMDGQEMDFREEGGFVPIGRMEKADDVPARLSKNEFVFTADAVRNAGEGDVDKGAEVMYNMMKNLESGGEVSEESQGLEGAREMFQTSQRLEEVI